MNAFLITFKPASESAERGMPIGELRGLIERLRVGEAAEDKWRFSNRKDVSIGGRVFLLLQGRSGPAIIGYGQITGEPEITSGTCRVPVLFEQLADPRTEVLASPDELLAMDDAGRLWHTASSGIKIPDHLAERLERLVVGKPIQPRTDDAASNPDWTRDELIVALNFYLQHRSDIPNKESREIAGLSRTLRKLGVKLFSSEGLSSTFRNVNGVYMKLMNFRRLDPDYVASGRTGLSRGGKAEEEVWTEFAGNATLCKEIADAIIATLDDTKVGESDWPQFDDDSQEALEGRLLTRKHIYRERDRRLVKAKLKQVEKRKGKLACEICNFDFGDRYGDRGHGFIECHHTKPLTTLREGDKTRLDDLALVCSNCHRMIHRRKPWLSVEELRDRIRDPQPRTSPELTAGGSIRPAAATSAEVVTRTSEPL